MLIDNILTAENIIVKAGSKTILNDVSLNLPKGKLTVLIGPNGAGKSTLIRTLSGFNKPHSGKVVLLGKKLQNYSVKELSATRAVMKQSMAINFAFTAEQIIKMGAYQRGVQISEIFTEVVSLTNCQEIISKPYLSLSGGQQQRVQLARALMQIYQSDLSDKLLFLDEPTSALDLFFQQKSLQLVANLCHERGLTAFCSLHDLNLASLFCDQVLLLSDQKLQCFGDAQTVISSQNIKKFYAANVQVVEHCACKVPQIQLQRSN